MAVMCLCNYRKILAAISLAWLRHFFINIKNIILINSPQMPPPARQNVSPARAYDPALTCVVR